MLGLGALFFVNCQKVVILFLPQCDVLPCLIPLLCVVLLSREKKIGDFPFQLGQLKRVCYACDRGSWYVM